MSTGLGRRTEARGFQSAQASPDLLLEVPGDAATRERDLRHVWHPLAQDVRDPRELLVVEQASGHFIQDDRGRAYLDAMAGLWCVNVGYGRRSIADAAYRQMKRLAYYPHTWANAPAAELAQRLSDLLDASAARPGREARSRGWRSYFVQSGSEANETAFKIARQYQLRRRPGERRYKIIGRRLAYHGTTLATLAAGGMAPRSERFEPLPGGFVRAPAPYCYRCPFGLKYPSCGVACAHAVEEAIVGEGPETVAAVVLEPIQSGAGVLDPPDEYLPIVAEACRRHGVLLILDEVVTGFGRTGRWFGHQWFGVAPDIVTLAKGLSSGYMPIGAMVAAGHVYEVFSGTASGGTGDGTGGGTGRGTGGHPTGAVQVSTFGGHAAAAAAALANIEIIASERLVEQADRVGRHLKHALARLRRHALVGDVRGRGLLLAVELVRDAASREPLDEAHAAAVVRDCLHAGVIVGRTAHTAARGGNTLTIAPPLTWTEDEADHLVDTLDWALARAAGR